MPSLYLSLEHQPEKRPEYQNPENPWGKLRLYLDDGLDYTELLSLEWNLNYFISWYLNQHLHMLGDRFALFNRKDGQSISEFLEEPMTRQRQDYYSYLHTHSYGSAVDLFTPAPKIIVGLAKEPYIGEVSLWEKFHTDERPEALQYLAPPWAYPIDMKQYRQDSRFEVIRFLEEWQDIAPLSMKKRALNVFRKALDSPE